MVVALKKPWVSEDGRGEMEKKINKKKDGEAAGHPRGMEEWNSRPALFLGSFYIFLIAWVARFWLDED